MNNFIVGRQAELSELTSLLETKKANLVVFMGRRRIGKSTLARFFGKKHFKTFLEFSGLAPRGKQTNQEQLDHFSQQMMEQTGWKGLQFKNWEEAFLALHKMTSKEKVFILLDEVSWMGGLDPDFSGKLKVAWDTHFSSNKNLFMVLCGSVTSWIEENILFKADFVGRISAEFRLKELPLNELKGFWRNKIAHLSSKKLTHVLMVAGGVPRYLEEFRINTSSEQEIARLCFRRTGFLFNEYEKIFSEIFQKKSDTYRKIVEKIIDGPLTAMQIAKKLKITLNRDLSRYLYILEISGFLNREYTYSKDFKKTKLSRYRLSDNYLRFYLKYIQPNRDQIELGTFSIQSVQQLHQWNTWSGFLFENLILNHRLEVIEKLQIPKELVVSASPYFQVKKTRNKGACQIDLLIQQKKDTLYVCEIKHKECIDKSVIKEVQAKIEKLEKKKGISVRPVLIYQGRLQDEDLLREYFDKLLSMDEILELQS
jgi:AAA+ ATPase superfamily predicted ATPase